MSEVFGDKPLFRLYVVERNITTPRTIQGVRDALSVLLGADGFELEVFDVVSDPRAAFEGRIKATPTLVRTYPRPEVRIIGDMGNPERFIPVLGDMGRVGGRASYSRKK